MMQRWADYLDNLREGKVVDSKPSASIELAKSAPRATATTKPLPEFRAQTITAPPVNIKAAESANALLENVAKITANGKR